MKKTLAVFLLAFSMSAFADARYYGEFKNDLQFEEFDYQDESYRNNLRFGVLYNGFYAEAGTTQIPGEFGTSFELGFKRNINERIEVKGKLEGYDFDNSDVSSKLETEVRYYFN